MNGCELMEHFGHLAARPVLDRDGDFLARLYASTRTDLLHLPVPRDVVDAIVRHQQLLQATGYAASYPDARYLFWNTWARQSGGWCSTRHQASYGSWISRSRPESGARGTPVRCFRHCRRARGRSKPR